jgi:5,10-methylenetetrahydrofolate reductase
MKYEITIDTEKDLHDALEIIKKNNLQDINITHKKTTLQNYEAAQKIHEQIPNLNITLHLSMKYLQGNSDNETEKNIMNYLKHIQSTKTNNILLISGTPKPQYDSIKSLKFINTIQPEIKIYVAYNPYFSDEKLEKENQRLKEKLKNTVSGVYLQIGIDQKKLDDGVNYLRKMDSTIQLFGSLLIPNPEILRRFKQKPIQEIFLSEKYLNNLDFAQQKTDEIREIYKKNNITPLIENIPFTQINPLSAKL